MGAGACQAKPGRLEYRAWLQAYHSRPLEQWAAILLVVLAINLKGDGTNRGVPGVVHTLLTSLSCIGVLWGLRTTSTQLVHWSFIAFALLQLSIHYDLGSSSEKGPNSVHAVADIIALPLTKLPRMLVTEADPCTFISIFVGDVFVSARFYLNIVGHSPILSCLRAVLMHSLCVACYLNIRGKTRRAYQIAHGLTDGRAINASLPVPAAISSVSQTGKSNLAVAHNGADQNKPGQQAGEQKKQGRQQLPQGGQEQGASTAAEAEVGGSSHGSATGLEESSGIAGPEDNTDPIGGARGVADFPKLHSESCGSSPISSTGARSSSSFNSNDSSWSSGPGLLSSTGDPVEDNQFQCSCRSPTAAPSLLVQRELKKAMSRKACAHQHAAYASRISSGPSKAEQCVQEAWRFAVKVDGHCGPDRVPDMALHLLQQRLHRYARLSGIEGPSVRSGCLVISFNAQTPPSSIQDAKDDVLSEVKEWALEQGLMAADRDEIHIQACPLQKWGKGVQQQAQFSMSLRTPIVVASPPSLGMQASQHQHPAQLAPGPPISIEYAQEDTCMFELTLAAPRELELRGWQGADDAPEELPEDVKSRGLCLLASLDDGQDFLATAVEQLSMKSNGELEARLRVSLPEGVFDAPLSPKVMVLELWAAGGLVCSYSAVVLPSDCGGVMAELEGWNSGDELEKEAFVCAFVHWLSFQAHSRTSQQQQQQQDLRMVGEASDTANMQQVVGPMADQGKILLDCALELGMLTVAGLLVDGLIKPPFCLSLDSLLGMYASGGDQHAPEASSAGIQQPQGSDLDGGAQHALEPTSVNNRQPPHSASGPAGGDQHALEPASMSSIQQPPDLASGPADSLPPIQQQPSCLGPAANEPNVSVESQPSVHGHATKSTQAGQHAAPLAPSLWAQAVRGSIHGFQQASDAACGAESSQQQQQQQQQQALRGLPTESGYKQWGEAYMRHSMNIRFNCCLLGAVIAPFKSKMLAGELLQTVLLLVNAMPYIYYFYTPKVGLQTAKYIHLTLWALMGIGLYDPPESNTKNMVLFKAEVFVLVLFFSPVHEQAGLRALLLERALTTIVLALLYKGLHIKFFISRSLLVNLVSLFIEYAMDVYFRYLFLKHVADQQPQGRHKHQQQQQMLPLKTNL